MRLLPRALAALLALSFLLGACTGSRILPGMNEIAGEDRDAEPPVPPQPQVVVAWSAKRLPAALIGAATSLPGIVTVSPRRSGTLDLRSVEGASKPLQRRPAGATLPVSVVAIEPAYLARIAGEAIALAVKRGEAVLPVASASLRGVEVGDAITLAAGRASVRLRVGAIAGDEHGFRAEVVVGGAVASKLGLGEVRGLNLIVEPGREIAIERDLERLAGTFPLRIRHAGAATPPSAPPAAVSSPPRRGLLSLLDLKREFGEFWYRRSGNRLSIDPAWVEANIVDAEVPLLGRVKCHRRIVPLIVGAMNEIIEQRLAHEVRSFQGCYSPRMQVASDDAISRHAYGVAFDFNAPENGYGATPTMNERVVSIVEGWGFTWGGRWTVPDGMHFEFVRWPDR